MSKRQYLLVILSFVIACYPALAVEKYKPAPGYGWDKRPTLSYSQGDVQMMSDFLFRGNLSVNGKLSQEDIGFIRKKKISFVSTESNADPDLFEYPRLFPRLCSALIKSRFNKTHLAALTKNYPRIHNLVIKQNQPLSLMEMKLIKSLKSLDYLELICPVESSAVMNCSFPTTISFLNLYKTALAESSNSVELNLPRLNRMSLSCENINSQFLNKVNAPFLEELDLDYSFIEPGGLMSISKFQRLKRVSLYHSTISKSDLKELLNSKLRKGLKLGKTNIDKEVDLLISEINVKTGPADKSCNESAQVRGDFKEGDKIESEIENRQPAGYDIKVGSRIGVLMTERYYKQGDRVTGYFLLDCQDRILLTDDGKFFQD